jgi:NAD(P)-dependent dehydrogenase (short-subunit alcohol dehydrogenase family)
MHPLDLGGKTVLVTGASSGIGRDAAIFLSQCNARVILTARNRERLEQTAAELSGTGHIIETLDLASGDQIPGVLKKLCESIGPLHGLVHCAGVHSPHPLRVLTAEKLETVMRINVSSAAMLAKGFRQKGCSSSGSAIVLISSVAGIAGEAGVSAYAASKAAIIGLCRSLAMELAGQGIRVNCVAPGFVRTEMAERIEAALTPEQFQALEAKHPLGFGTPRDVSHAIVFLLAETARWITGTTLVIDGGYTLG